MSIVWTGPLASVEFVAETTTPSASSEPSLRPGLSDTDVAPGFVGFAVTFAVVIAVMGLMISMSRRVRRINHAKGASHEVSANLRDQGDDIAGNGAPSKAPDDQP